MILLTSPTDQLLVTSSSAASLSVHTTWVDTLLSSGTITPGRTNTNMAVAATISAAAPAVATSVQRNVKTLHVRNKDTTLSADVTVQHTDGTLTVDLYKTTLAPGVAFQYTDHGGFAGLQG